MPWASIFRNLAEKYHWTFDDIGRLTLYQTLVASGAWCPEDIFEKRSA